MEPIMQGMLRRYWFISLLIASRLLSEVGISTPCFIRLYLDLLFFIGPSPEIVTLETHRFAVDERLRCFEVRML